MRRIKELNFEEENNREKAEKASQKEKKKFSSGSQERKEINKDNKKEKSTSKREKGQSKLPQEDTPELSKEKDKLEQKKYDFSKKEDRKRFKNLPEEERKRIIDKSQEEAKEVDKERNESIQELKDSVFQESLLGRTKGIDKAFQRVRKNLTDSEIKNILQKNMESTLLEWHDIGIARDIVRFSQGHNVLLDFSRPEIRIGLQKDLEKALSEGEIDDSEDIIKLADKIKVPLDFSRPEMRDSFQKGLEETISNGGMEYVQIMTKLIRDNSPVANDIINKSIDNFLDKKLEKWGNVARVLSVMNSLSKEKSERKNIRNKIILKLTERIGDLQSTKARDDIETSLLNTGNQLKEMLQNDLPESGVFDRQLIENLYNKIPSAEGNLIQNVRNDAMDLQNLNIDLEPVRDLIHNHPNQDNLKIINKFIDLLESSPKEKDKKEDALRSVWLSDPINERWDFYSKERLENFRRNPNILKVFDKLKNDLEKIWSNEGLEEKMEEKALRMPENIKKDIEEVTYQITPDDKGVKEEHKDIAETILRARKDINWDINHKKGSIADEYILDELLKQESYKNYGEWQNSIKEINKKNLPDAVNMLKSTLSEMETDGLSNKSLQRAERIINNLNVDSKENLPKLYSQINVINKEITKTLDSLGKEFYELIAETYPNMPPAKKEVLFSQFYKNNAIDFASKISSRLGGYLRSQNITLGKQEKERRIIN